MHASTSPTPTPDFIAPATLERARRLLDLAIGPLPRPEDSYLLQLLIIVGTTFTCYAHWLKEDPYWGHVSNQALALAMELEPRRKAYAPFIREEELATNADRYVIATGLVRLANSYDGGKHYRFGAMCLWPWALAARRQGADEMLPAHVQALGTLLRRMAAKRLDPRLKPLRDIRLPQAAEEATRSVPSEFREAFAACTESLCTHIEEYRSKEGAAASPPSPGDLRVPGTEPAPDPQLVPTTSEAASLEEDDEPSFLGRAPRAAFASALENNHVAWLWKTLTRRESLVLSRAISDEARSGLLSAGSVGITLILCLGVPIRHLPELDIAENLQAALPIVESGRIVIVHCGEVLFALLPRLLPDDAVHPAPNPHLLETKAFSVVGLPAFLLARLRPGNVGQMFPTLVAQVREKLKHLRLETGLRLYPGRIAKALETQVAVNTRDEWLASQCVAYPLLPQGNSIYYASIPCTRVYQIHATALADLTGWQLPDLTDQTRLLLGTAVVGSRLSLPATLVAARFETLRQTASSATLTGRRTPDSMAEAFNAIALYSLWLLLLVTTHRPTKVFFPSGKQLSVALAEAIIADKRSNPRVTHRIVPLSRVALAQYERFLESAATTSAFFTSANRRALASELAALGSADSTPFCVLRKAREQWRLQPITRRDLDAFWPDQPSSESNWWRHFLIQQLTANGVSREDIALLVGHAETGQTPFGHDSGLSVGAFLARVRPALDRIGEQLRLRPIPAMRAYQRAAA